MTSDAFPRPPANATRAVLLLALGLAAASPLRAAEGGYPFEGTWVRSNRVCVANAPLVRTYTAHDVTFAKGHCSFRKVAVGGGQFELFEDCRRAERPGNYTETLRMLSPDLMVMRRQAARLKIARPLRFTRCSIAAPPPAGPAKAAPVHKPGPGLEPPRATAPKAGEAPAAEPKPATPPQP